MISNITMILFFLTGIVQGTIHLQVPSDGCSLTSQAIHPSESESPFGGFGFSGIQKDVAKATGFSLTPCAFELYNESGTQIGSYDHIEDGSTVEVRTVRAQLPDGRFLTLTPGKTCSFGLEVSGADAFASIRNQFRQDKDAGHFSGIELDHRDVTLTLPDGTELDTKMCTLYGSAKVGDDITVALTEEGRSKYDAYTANTSGTGAGLTHRLAAAAAPQPAASTAESRRRETDYTDTNSGTPTRRADTQPSQSQTAVEKFDALFAAAPLGFDGLDVTSMRAMLVEQKASAAEAEEKYLKDKKASEAVAAKQAEQRAMVGAWSEEEAGRIDGLKRKIAAARERGSDYEVERLTEELVTGGKPQPKLTSLFDF